MTRIKEELASVGGGFGNPVRGVEVTYEIVRDLEPGEAKPAAAVVVKDDEPIVKKVKS